MGLNQLKNLFDMGFSLIPLAAWNEGEDDKKGKASKIGWQKYTQEKADWESVEKRYKTWRDCNWGRLWESIRAGHRG